VPYSGYPHTVEYRVSKNRLAKAEEQPEVPITYQQKKMIKSMIWVIHSKLSFCDSKQDIFVHKLDNFADIGCIFLAKEKKKIKHNK
jgi:hypothetical protein